VKPHEFPEGDIVRISHLYATTRLLPEAHRFIDQVGIITKRYLDFEGHIAVIQFHNGRLRLNLERSGDLIEKL